MFGDDDNQNDNLHPNNTGKVIMPSPDGTLSASSPLPADDHTPSAPPLQDTPGPVEGTPVSDTPSPASLPKPSNDEDLLDLKQEALQQLSPLLDHLEQTPEEKFKTTMMMIQAADNKALVKTAYEAAKQITDEKARAQALLDVINEINYFTHQPEEEAGD